MLNLFASCPALLQKKGRSYRLNAQTVRSHAQIVHSDNGWAEMKINAV